MLKNAKPITLKHQRLWMLPQKALYWQKQKTLLVADLHIGKSDHFRSNGIPVPAALNRNNFGLLNQLMEKINPKHVIFLGDLFHSRWNEQWQQFKLWRRQYPSVKVSLVMGNHDILPKKFYHAAHLSVFQRLRIPPFLFIHDPEQAPDSSSDSKPYILAGHLHPAIKMKGKGRQTMKFPCFHFGRKTGILPAFGHFTGTAIIKPAKKDRVFLIVEKQILPTR